MDAMKDPTKRVSAPLARPRFPRRSRLADLIHQVRSFPEWTLFAPRGCLPARCRHVLSELAAVLPRSDALACPEVACFRSIFWIACAAASEADLLGVVSWLCSNVEKNLGAFLLDALQVGSSPAHSHSNSNARFVGSSRLSCTIIASSLDKFLDG